MNADKRRRARVQGGWASPAASVPRSDSHKPKVPSVPAWVGKNADSEQKSKTAFVYKEPTEELKQETKQTVVEKAGVYDLSTEPSGVSRIRLFPNFLDSKECEWMYEQLFHELPWSQKTDSKNGEVYQQPRLTAWYGDMAYAYSGVVQDANTKWTPLLVILKERLEANTGLRFNSMLANLYRDGRDHVPWHADDEKGLGTNPTIASVSFGDTRNFELRRKPPTSADRADYVPTEVVKVPLDAGTLLIMEGCTNHDWQHRIAREYHNRGPRINLTFRVTSPV